MKLDHNLTIDEPFMPWKTWKIHVKKKQLAYERTTKSSYVVIYFETQDRHSQHLRSTHAIKQRQIKKNHRKLRNLHKL